MHAVDVVADHKHGLAYDRVVREYYLLARDSVDELAMERLGGKALTQDALMAFAKRRSKA